VPFPAVVGRLGEAPAIARQVLVGHLQGGVGEGPGEVQEERTPAVALEERERLLQEAVLRVHRAHAIARAVSGQLLALVIAPESRGVVVLCRALAQEAVEGVEALLAGMAARSRPAQTPLPDRAGGVAVLAQEAGQRERVRRERLL